MSKGLYLCKECRSQISVTAGTIFQDTRKPLILWFRAMWYVASYEKRISASGLQRTLDLGSYKTAWTWFHKLRCAMVSPSKDLLRGTVEIGDIYIGSEKRSKRGNGTERDTLVFVAAEGDGNRISRIRLHRVADASSSSLSSAVIMCVRPGSHVHTDESYGYLTIPSRYDHVVIRKKDNFGRDLLPLVDQVVSDLDSWYQGSVRMSHIDFYLDEFTFRFNQRASRSQGKLFYKLMKNALTAAPVTGDQIRGGGSHR
jgi:ISXO2-like transposase domain